MAKKLKVILKATDQKALDDYQDLEKMSIAEQSIIKIARLGKYKFFSYDPDLGKNKHVLEILKGKSKISPRKVQELLSPLVKDKDSYVSKAITYLISLSPRCFWVEVSKATGVKSKNDFGCTREYELGISEFAAHHATKNKSETDKPYDENLGLYKSISGSSPAFIYYYKSEEELRNKILEVLRQRSQNVNAPFIDLLKDFQKNE